MALNFSQESETNLQAKKFFGIDFCKSCLKKCIINAVRTSLVKISKKYQIGEFKKYWYFKLQSFIFA